MKQMVELTNNYFSEAIKNMFKTLKEIIINEQMGNLSQ